jgi:2-keto-3-deoxy-L-rhamnonate aldolase RhmA
MNAFRHLLKAAGAHPPIGTWIMSASPIVAEAVGHAGFDWGVIDMEHSPLGIMEVAQMLQALNCTKMVPVVRVPWNDAVTVKRVLDAGATTVMFPFVQTPQEAERAVAATRYPPEGIRGMAGMSRASRFGTTPNYAQTANRGMGVIIQLETPEAVRSMEAIAAVEGVDAIFIGPADLSASMGYVGQLTHPEVMDLMGRAAQTGRRLGKPVGTVGGTPEVVAQYRAAGFSYVAIGSDLGLLMRGSQAAVNALRTQEVGALVHSVTSGTRTNDGGGY